MRSLVCAFVAHMQQSQVFWRGAPILPGMLDIPYLQGVNWYMW